MKILRCSSENLHFSHLSAHFSGVHRRVRLREKELKCVLEKCLRCLIYFQILVLSFSHRFQMNLS